MNDYLEQQSLIDFNLFQLEQQRKALVSRKKLITRKINILNEKFDKAKDDCINWSANDFDDLDILG